jgi:hypothetical protein
MVGVALEAANAFEKVEVEAKSLKFRSVGTRGDSKDCAATLNPGEANAFAQGTQGICGEADAEAG